MTQQYNLHLGDNLITLKSYPDNTFDSIVTDPPYGIDFLGKAWNAPEVDPNPLPDNLFGDGE